MNLSKAMLLGCQISAPTVGKLMDGEKACALGAALLVGGTLVPRRKAGDMLTPRTTTPIQDNSGYAMMIPEDWATLLQVERPCPDCGEELELHILIAHLNDTHLWPREMTALFVASVEQTLEKGEPCQQSSSSFSSSSS